MQNRQSTRNKKKKQTKFKKDRTPFRMYNIFIFVFVIEFLFLLYLVFQVSLNQQVIDFFLLFINS